MKKLAAWVVSHKWGNYLTAIITAFLLFLILYTFLYRKVQIKIESAYQLDLQSMYYLNLFVFWFTLILSFWVVYKSKLVAEPRTARHLIDTIFEEETDVWIQGTTRFGFYLYRFDKKSQTISTEKDDIVREILCSDKVGKLLEVKTSGTWVVGTSNQERLNFKLLEDDETENEILIGNVVDRATNRLIESKEYWGEIKGRHANLIDELRNDTIFQQDCLGYGIRFPSLSVMVKAKSQEMDDFNAQYDRELGKLQSKYPANHNFTHDEIKEMSDLIFVKLGRAKQLIVRGGAVVRADATVN